MSDNVLDELMEIFEIRQDTEIEFKEMYGLTFAFIRKITQIKERISSAEISPLGIIYSKNGEYYFAPLDEVQNINEIVREYVKNYIQK